MTVRIARALEEDLRDRPTQAAEHGRHHHQAEAKQVEVCITNAESTGIIF